MKPKLWKNYTPAALLARMEQLAVDKPVELAFGIAVVVAVIVIGASWQYWTTDFREFLKNVAVEAHGMVFDLIVIGWLILWLNKRAERRMDIRRYKEEIDDYRNWKQEEASHRIAGIIKRLNKNGVTQINLSKCFLKGADLIGANLSNANLCLANLSKANLRKANLLSADLLSADLSDAVLYRADLRNANLSNADLRGAILLATDLRKVIGLRKEQLEGGDKPFLYLVNLPEGMGVDPNRDCDRLPQELLAQYPKEFKTIEDAKDYIDRAREKKWD